MLQVWRNGTQVQRVSIVEESKGGEEERVVYVAKPQKAQQKRGPACPIREKAQEGEKKLRRVEEEEAAHVAKPREAQKE